MTDRLEEIKKRNDPIFGGHWHSQELPIRQGDYIWLRDEVERMRANEERLKNELNSYEALIDILNLIAPREVEKAIDIREEDNS
ncbi:hypothetical protein NIE88_18730 [Sporolactobacillus shoreicorticis]|uniref:Uncharacterized protein n=1 Tax=Sporolactobacillus shoreicorticis TaxID=1923877 RepID=A0ABW5S7Q2_9BACL|nr:hypothetical protein [Sporolactobacillus shoreicorticis]MCO7127785.1 hypothetical protein [Sporolactobacillus shoreicorticis]